MPGQDPRERKAVILERAAAAVILVVFGIVLYMVFIYRP